MQQLISQLGIDWHLLLSQAVNFLLLLIILRLFVYRPLLKLMHDRQNRISDGLTKAKMADDRLREIDALGEEKVRAAEMRALKIIQDTENSAKDLEAELLSQVKHREAEAMRDSEAAIKAKEAEAKKEMEREAADLVRRAIAKTVQLAPEQIDNTLIAKAVGEIKKSQ